MLAGRLEPMGPGAAAEVSTAENPSRRSRPYTDRRVRPTPAVSLYSLTRRGRRSSIRRHADRFKHACVDRYDLHSLLVILTGLLLCIADGFFTLQLVERGAREINPVMHFFLALGPVTFLAVKYLATGCSLVVLLIYKNRPLLKERLHGRHLLAAVPFVYSLLILWELSLNLRLA